MPAIAKGSLRDQSAFYWHLGDFRAIHEYDEDILARKSLDFSDYTDMAWDDFLQMQIAPFQAAHLPVHLGIGNSGNQATTGKSGNPAGNDLESALAMSKRTRWVGQSL
jgi:hypothetical protein